MIYCYDMSLYYFAVGIVLSWNMTLNETPHADIASYQLFAYQEGTSTPSTTLWKKVGISSQSKKGNLIQRASQTNTCTFNQFVPLSDIRQLFFEWIFVCCRWGMWRRCLYPWPVLWHSFRRGTSTTLLSAPWMHWGVTVISVTPAQYTCSPTRRISNSLL